MTITIPKETLNHWKALRSSEDVTKIMKLLGKKKRGPVYYILSTGKCNSKSIAAKLINYHAELEKEIEMLKQQLEQEA